MEYGVGKRQANASSTPKRMVLDMEYGVGKQQVNASRLSCSDVTEVKDAPAAVCASCEETVDRLVPAYWDRAIGFCSACCVALAEECDAAGAWPALPAGPPVDLVSAAARVFSFRLWHGVRSPKLRTRTTQTHWLCVGGPMHGAKLAKEWAGTRTAVKGEDGETSYQPPPPFQVEDWLGCYRFNLQDNRFEWRPEEERPPTVGPIAG